MTASTRCPRKDIERKRAHIVGGGIAGLATAVFLVDEAHMPAKNITIYESAAAEWRLSGGRLGPEGGGVQESRIAHVRAALRVPVLPDGKNSVDTDSGPYAPRRDIPGERG